MITKEDKKRIRNLENNLNIKKGKVIDFLIWILNKNIVDEQFSLRDKYNKEKQDEK